jgi:hypothetical protein
MKHIKTFEDNIQFNIGDNVIFIGDNKESAIKYGYNIGDLCIIENKMPTFVEVLYEIKNINNNKAVNIWVYDFQIRKAKKLEIEQNKFNL